MRSLDDLRAYPFPNTGNAYRAGSLERAVATWRAGGLAVGGNLPHLGGELFEAAWRLRGLENFLLDLVRRPEWADYLLDRLAALARRRYGPRLALWGAVGRQNLFGRGTREEIRREVRERIETLGRAGLVLCPAYDVDTPDIPWENVEAFLEAVQEYG